MIRNALGLAVLVGATVALSPLASAKPPAAPSPPAAAAAQPAAGPELLGPQKIKLGHELMLDLPGDSVFLGMPEAGKLMEEHGNFHNEDLLGIIASKNQEDTWFVTVRYDAEGYIKDDEKIDADELLKAFKEDQEQVNKEKVEKGFKPLRLDGWAEPPVYQKDSHHLVWALLVSSDDHGASVNYNTRVLGRKGFVSLNLVTSKERFELDRPVATRLLAATTFDTGSRYEDFDKKTDKVAEYGLVGLILGGVGLGALKLAKVGIFATIFKPLGLLLLKGGKLIAAAFVGLFMWLKRLFGGGKTDVPAPPESPVPGGTPATPPPADSSGGGAGSTGSGDSGGGAGAAGGGGAPSGGGGHGDGGPDFH